MTHRLGLLTAALLLVARPAASQSVGGMLLDDLRGAGGDVLAIWTAPFDASAHDWLLTAAAFAATGIAMPADEPVADWVRRAEEDNAFEVLRPLRHGGALYTGKTVVPPVAAAYVLGLALKNRDLRDAVMGCLSTWGAQGPLRKALYAAVGRARPDSIPDDPQVWRVPSGGSWEMHSFPAGHFANAMGCATYWDKRFRLGLAAPLLYAVAAGVGLGRMADDGHWLSDTVIGGFLGYAVGAEVARRSLARLHATDAGEARRTMDLYVVPDGAATRIGLRLGFRGSLPR